MVLTFPAGSLHRYNLAKQRQCYMTRADSCLGFFAFSRSLFAVQLLHIKFLRNKNVGNVSVDLLKRSLSMVYFQLYCQ